MRALGFTFLLLFPLFSLSTEKEDHWSSHIEAKPDIHPDGWIVDNLVKSPGDEVLLRSSSGAMLRWLFIPQLKMMQDIRYQISDAAELTVDFLLIPGDAPNAAAGFRNGRPVIFVNFAMFDLIGDDQAMWAALIGHEIAHLKLNHLDKQAKRQVPITILKSVAQGVLGDSTTSAASGYLIDGVATKFSRDDERQSDYMGVIWAVQAGHDPYGAARLHQLLQQQSSILNIPFLSTHPTSKERTKTLTELADRVAPD